MPSGIRVQCDKQLDETTGVSRLDFKRIIAHIARYFQKQYHYDLVSWLPKQARGFWDE